MKKVKIKRTYKSDNILLWDTFETFYSFRPKLRIVLHLLRDLGLEVHDAVYAQVAWSNVSQEGQSEPWEHARTAYVVVAFLAFVLV